VISQLHIIAGTQAMDIGGTGWKIVGNEMQCPNADDQVGCFEMSEGNQVKFWAMKSITRASILRRPSITTRFISAPIQTISTWAGTISRQLHLPRAAIPFFTAVQPFLRGRRYNGL